MRHSYVLEGHAFRLRPVSEDDARFIISLRSNPELNQYLHSTTNTIKDQLDWYENYYKRENDYYFIIESLHKHISEGVVSLYKVNTVDMHGEWGRWILTPGSLAAIESAWLIYRFAFEVLGLRSVYCRTAAANKKVVSFHDSCGISNRKRLSNYLILNGKEVDAIEHLLESDQWPEVQRKLEKLSRLTARKLSDA